MRCARRFSIVRKGARLWATALVAALFSISGQGWAQSQEGTVTRSWTLQGLTRTARFHAGSKAPAKSMAAVLVLHGAGSGAQQIERLTHFSELADEEGFLVIYPEAVAHHWNDGRPADSYPGSQSQVDDVAFLGEVISTALKDYGADPKRIYVCGLSSGGMMAQRLAKENAGVAGVAAVAGHLPRSWGPSLSLQRPLHVLLISGTADPFMPYVGGTVRFFGGRSRGDVLGSEETLNLWGKAVGCQVRDPESLMPDSNSADQCQSYRTVSRNPGSGAVVSRIRIDGGGHGWPGSSQYLPASLVGAITQDFEATTEIWSFFKGVSQR